MRRAFTVAVLLAVSSCSELDQAAPTAPGVRASGEELLRELRQVHRSLREIRLKADQHARVGEARESLAALTHAAMVELDADYEARRKRVEKVAGELSKAEREGDQGRVDALVQDLIPLSQGLDEIYRSATQRPEVVAQQMVVDRLLEAGMRERDPELDALTLRADALRTSFRNAIAPRGGFGR